MADFVPRAGRAYAAERNFDRGPGGRSNVSNLSPYIRFRIVTESELLSAVLERFSLSSAEKFVQEIFWRTYWKGWLEAHPAAWSRYRATLAQRLAELDADAGRRAAYDAAVDGRTGIDAFDAWARELVAANYLHNHARMWFASIWIFTLGLPWELGADFFMRHLLDGDPAANTLSWRWVAGLQTRGKTYTATRDNIRRYTENRFELTASLARSTEARVDLPIPLGPAVEVPLATPSDEPSLLVVHEDDLHGDLREFPASCVRAVCAVKVTPGRSPQPLSPAVLAFADGAAREASARIAARVDGLDGGLIEATEPEALITALGAVAAAGGATRLLVPFAPVGPARDSIDRLRAAGARAGFGYTEFGRRYDALSWPAATRGFFNLRTRIPTILAELGLGAG